MIFCTAGHVDHGKTALVRALTGVDTDRLAEERRRGLTIELGFAPWSSPGVGRVSLVDVPGHAQFIPTMLSGCGGLDGALFTVAADEGPMPQTAEHLDILSLLGLERGVVALTRADLASPAARAEVEARTRALTAGTFLEGAPRIFVSAVTGEGLEALRAALAAMARQAPPPPEGSPRLHVDRVFSVDGSGTVVTGTLTGGPLRRGDRVRLYPGGQTARVRGLQCHGVPAEALPAGVRAAVNLAGVRLRDVGRGDTLAAPGALTLTDRTDVSLRVLPDAPFPVHTGSQLHFHHGARALVCQPHPPGAGRASPRRGGVGPAPLHPARRRRPRRPVCGALLLPLATVGGGVLVDLAPPARAACGRSGWPGWPPWRRGGPSWRRNPRRPGGSGGPRPVGGGGGELEALYLGYGLEPPPGRGWSPALPGGSGRRGGPAAA
ncbi:MAG: selenocysteine-specific translation elongation factor [Flavonifractor plautii]